MKKKWKMMLMVTIVCILVVSMVAIIATRNNAKDQNEYGIYSSDPYDSATIPHDLFLPKSLNTTIERLAVTPIWNDLTQDYRPRWEGCSDKEYLQIFGELPKMPQDFYKKYKMFLEGKITDYDRLGEEYWKQPEFFRLDQSFFNTYINRWHGQWNIGEISCMPSFRYAELKRGATVSLSTFFHTDIVGTEAYLGSVIYAMYPDSCMNHEGEVVFNQPSNANKYIKAKITSPDNNPIYETASFQSRIEGLNNNVNLDNRLLIFPSTYRSVDIEGETQIEGFPSNWCFKVTLEISIEDNCPSGDYVVAIDIKNPAGPVIEEYNWVISGHPYYSFFFPGTRGWKPECPFFQVIITVV